MTAEADKRCGQCKWHFDPRGLAGPDDPKHCYAVPSDQVYLFLFKPGAHCSFPDKFELVPKKECETMKKPT